MVSGTPGGLLAMEITSPILPALEPRVGQFLVPVCTRQLFGGWKTIQPGRGVFFSFDEVPTTQQLFQSVKWRHKKSPLQTFLSFSFLRHFLCIDLAVPEPG